MDRPITTLFMLMSVDGKISTGPLRRYDTAKPPLRQKKIFTAILRALCGMSMLGQDYKIEKIGMEGLKPPYILLSNHMYFVDFHLSAADFSATSPAESTWGMVE